MQVEVVDHEVRYGGRDERAACFEEPPERQPEEHAERGPEPEASVLCCVGEPKHHRRGDQSESRLEEPSKDELLCEGAGTGLGEDVAWPEEAADDLAEPIGHPTHRGGPASGALTHRDNSQTERDAERDVGGCIVPRARPEEPCERVTEEGRHGERNAAEGCVGEDDRLPSGAHHLGDNTSAD